MEKNQFINVTEKEQKLFEDLSGQNDKVLLLYINEVTEEGEDFLEYYFTYSDATAEKFGIETFYAKVRKDDKKKELISRAVSRLTEKMVKRNLNEVEILEEPIISNQIYGSSPINTINEVKFEVAVDYSTSSQANYELQSSTQKGSFCCLLRNSENASYYVLTAYHCLDNDAFIEDRKAKLEYKEIREEINLIIDPESVTKNNALTLKGLDASIIQVDKGENPKFVKTYFYKNLISPKTPCQCNIIGNGKMVAFYKFEKAIESKETKKWKFNIPQSPLDGKSGGLLMNDNTNIIGVYDGGTDTIAYAKFCEIIKILGDKYRIV